MPKLRARPLVGIPYALPVDPAPVLATYPEELGERTVSNLD